MDKITNFFVDKNVMYLAQSMKFTSIYDIPPEDFYLLHIDNVCYDEQAPKKEALENVLSSLNIEGINFIFLIVGQKEKVDFYYGISRDICCKKKPRYSIQDIGKRILLPAIQGNFRGSRVRAVPQEQGRDIHKALLSMEHLSVIEGVPGANKDDEKYQGIDRLVNVMYGDSYCFLVVANPLETDQIIEVQEGLYNWITTNELGMIAGLPQKEVVGLSLNEEVEFGLNCTHPEEEDRIYLGSLIQNGNVLQSPIYLNKKDLDKHIFVAGVTGSGKTTTCQRILTEADIPFLVIEPAKTEYRVMIDHHPDLLVFTLGDNQTTPLRMNPLMFYPGESITSRVDMLCACIESAFDMEAAIPQIIEQALYKSYEEKGWNIYTNRNNKYKNPFDGTGKAFPMISNLIIHQIDLERIPRRIGERNHSFMLLRHMRLL